MHRFSERENCLVRARLFVVGSLFAAAVILSGCSTSWGLRFKPDDWAQMCEHNRAYIAAFERGDRAAMREAAERMRGDIELGQGSDGGTEWFAKLANAAAVGDTGPITQNIAVNCSY